ncbi:class II aldolase/adducin family protein [Streptomyces sp. NPDC053474]|uniref:class II aldolase/adducin family protein n=1 Tax=Streptomyces sp. NPDC053474 TaxID=3365704 RepID=UPI0037D47CEE
MPPVHDRPEDERRHRKERLAGALRVFGRLGYEDGVSGHITARDPEHPDRFWVNPFGMPFKHVTVSDLVLANAAGQVVEGCHHVNQAAFTVYAEVYRARPDAVAHCHSVHGHALADHKALILRNHGLLTVGGSVDAAAWWFISMERPSQVQLAARAAGHPVLIAHEEAVRTREQLGGDLVAWINYQSLWQDISRSEPDLLFWTRRTRRPAGPAPAPRQHA